MAVIFLACMACSRSSPYKPLKLEAIEASDDAVIITIGTTSEDYKMFLRDVPMRNVTAYVEPCSEGDGRRLVSNIGEWKIESMNRSIGDMTGIRFLARVTFSCRDPYTQIIDSEVRKVGSVEWPKACLRLKLGALDGVHYIGTTASGELQQVSQICHN